MARLSPEKSIAHLSIEVAVTPGKRNGIDSSLIGAFDETLRQARRSEGGAAADLAAPSQERRPPEATEAPNARTEREDRETDRVASEDREAASVSERETESNDEVESDKAATESEATSEESTEQTKAEEDADRRDEAADDTTDETAADVGTTAQAAVQEPVVEVIDPAASKEQGTEKDSPGDVIVKTAQESAGVQKSDSPSPEATAGVSKGESAIDEATIATEATDETIDATQEDPGEETESEAERSTPKREKTQDTKSLERSADENENSSEKPSNADGTTTISGEDPSDEQREHGNKRRGQPTRRERHDVAAQSNNAQATPAEADRGPQTTANPAASPLPDASNAPDAVAPELAATSDLSAAGSPSQTQTTGSADATAPVESRASTAQSQVAAGQGTGKGQGDAVDAAKFVQRVTNAFAALGQRSGPVRLKLYPPELGSLRMEITVKNGAMSARVEAETVAAKSVLLDNLPVLRERLAEQGIKVDRFDVDISDHSQGGPSERPDDGGRSFERSNRETGSRADARRPETTSTEQRDEQTLGIDGRLDVFI